MEPKIQAVDGTDVVNKIKENIEMMLNKKVMAVEVTGQFIHYLGHLTITDTVEDMICLLIVEMQVN